MRFGTGLLIVLGLCSGPGMLQRMQPAAADTPALGTASVMELHACRGMNAKQAHERADLAFRQRRYRQAGQCYLIAGDKPRADRAFIKAAAAEAPSTRRQLAANANEVKEQFRQFREAFSSR